MKSYAADRSKETKQALVPIFGREHVRVQHGKGTAFGWIHRYVQLPRPADCYCSRMPANDYGRRECCDPCRETREQAKRIIDKACEHIGYGSYCADDGYNTRREETLTNVTFDNEYSYRFGTKEAEWMTL